MEAKSVREKREYTKKQEKISWQTYLPLAFAAICLGILFIPGLPVAANYAITIAAVLAAGGESMLGALRALAKGKLSEGLLMLVAAIACVALREWREGAAIAIFFAVGEAFEGFAQQRSRKSISALASIRPETAAVRNADGTITETPVENVPVGTILVLRPFERVPLDGVIENGKTTMETAALTGEAIPREVGDGEEVLSGFLNGNAAVTIRTTKTAPNSAAQRMLQLVEDASRSKGESERFLQRFARYYLPIAMLIGALVAIVPSLITGDWRLWITRGLLVLVSSCPCAIVLSVPLSFFSAIGGAAKRNVLVKGSHAVELLCRAEIAVFDKTGTITTGDFSVKKLLPSGGFSEADLLQYASAAELHSDHPLARAIAQHGVAQLDKSAVSGSQEYPGGGTSAVFQSKRILCGSARFLREQGIDVTPNPTAQVYVAADGIFVGAIALESELHPDAAKTIESMRRAGFRRFVMLTGDMREPALQVAKQCGIGEVYAQLLPEEKSEHVKRLKADGTVVYVGDGINDAPALAMADIGAAMGFGAQSANEAADIVLVERSIAPLQAAHTLFCKAMRIVRFNVGFAVLAKIAVIVVGFFTAQPPIWMAVFADVGVMVLTVLNASRLLAKKG
jgi:Cd2+/Zn2+-exporting ATPase